KDVLNRRSAFWGEKKNTGRKKGEEVRQKKLKGPAAKLKARILENSGSDPLFFQKLHLNLRRRPFYRL
ncbi:MAG: hypothetical protein ACR2KX_11105, partial [Chitinophagaceae bacterium]